MKLEAFRIAALAATALTLGLAQATDYTFKNGARSSGTYYWNDPDTWDGVSYPQTADDNATFSNWLSPTLLITNDTEIGSLSTLNYDAMTFDMGGHTLTIHQQTSGQLLVGAPSTAKGVDPGYLPTFRNGSLIMTDDAQPFSIGQGGQNVSGGFTLDNCTSNLKIFRDWCYNPPRITIKNGGVWNCASPSFYQYNQKSSDMKGGYIRVTGAGSQLNVTNQDVQLAFTINFKEGGVYVQDGAAMNCSGNVAVSGTHFVGEQQNFATNSFIEVDNATLAIEKRLLLGGYYLYGFVEHEHHQSPTLIVKGKNASITAKEGLLIQEDIGAKMVFDVPQTGWTNAPLRVKSITFKPRNADYPHSGVTTNIIDAGAWVARANASIALVELENPDAAALQTLLAYTAVTNYNAVAFNEPPTVSVSADGKKLLLTAPESVNEDIFIPRYTATRSYVSPTSENVTLAFTTFGHEATLTTASVKLYDNAARTGEPVATYDFDLAAMTDPAGTYVAAFADLAERKTYWVKVEIVNSIGYSEDAALDFSTGATEGITFHWKGGAGVFEDANNWLNWAGKSVESYPTVGDTINISYADTVITLNNDERIAHIGNITSGDYAPVIDFNGHTLFTTSANTSETQITRYQYATEENLEPLAPALTLKNGTLDFPRDGCSATFGLANGSIKGAGSLIFDACTYDKGMLLRYIRNGFRLFVQNGSSVVIDGYPNGITDFSWDKNYMACGYGFICVRGDRSYFATSYDNGGSSQFCINGDHNGLYVLDGASALITMSLCLGTDMGTNNFAEVNNATLTPKYNLAFGFGNNWGNWVEKDTACRPQLRIKGANARVPVGKDLRILNGIGAVLSFDVPEAGFAATPLTAKTLTICEPTLGQAIGPTRLIVSARAWKRANPNAQQTLLALTTANAAGLQTLVDHATVDGSGCKLAVSADGTSIVLTAPPHQGLSLIIR